MKKSVPCDDMSDNNIDYVAFAEINLINAMLYAMDITFQLRKSVSCRDRESFPEYHTETIYCKKYTWQAKRKYIIHF